ncbi:cellulose synthase-like protein H1 [Pyrus communis]|uniref:cellulose synthase-like protein H1 n=1 Tax=Pyrus communis TaxID=23211 RepID=UPI0035C12006
MQVEEPVLIMFAAVFLPSLRPINHCKFLRMGFTGKISSATSLLLGLVTFLFKLLGISLVTYEVTQKDQPAHSCDYDEANARRFTFDESPMFAPATALLFLQLTALAMSLFGMQPLAMVHKAQDLGK